MELERSPPVQSNFLADRSRSSRKKQLLRGVYLRDWSFGNRQARQHRAHCQVVSDAAALNRLQMMHMPVVVRWPLIRESVVFQLRPSATTLGKRSQKESEM